MVGAIHPNEILYMFPHEAETILLQAPGVIYFPLHKNIPLPYKVGEYVFLIMRNIIYITPGACEFYVQMNIKIINKYVEKWVVWAYFEYELNLYK